MSPRFLAAVAAVVVLVPVGSGVGPFNPVVNGDFELYAETTGTGGVVDQALWWTSGLSGAVPTEPGYQSGTQFYDFTGDGDREAVIPGDPSAGTHNMWQSVLPPLQTYSANFQEFAFTIEAGTVAPSANNQIGLSLTPNFSQHPYAGLFWEGAVLFRADDMLSTMGPDGRVHLNPVQHGEIVCPATWDPCLQFRSLYNAGTPAQKSALLGQARVIQLSFWNFNQQTVGPVVIDNVAIQGALPPSGARVNPCIECFT